MMGFMNGISWILDAVQYFMRSGSNVSTQFLDKNPDVGNTAGLKSFKFLFYPAAAGSAAAPKAPRRYL